MSLTIISLAENSTMDGFNIHHSHSHGSTLRNIAITSSIPYPSSTAPSATVTTDSLISSVTRLVKRADATCSGKSDSAECETPVHTNYLAISLGVVIPLVSALAVLIYLHFRNMKLIKKEEEEDKAIDIDTDDFDPREAMGYRSNKMPSPMNEEKILSNTQAGPETPKKTHRPPPLNLQDPFAGPYQIPQLASSATSLNNYDPYDLSAYPPSIYNSPQYPPSIYRRSASPGSIISNPYSDSHQVPYGGKNPSQQALNPSTTSLNSLSQRSSDDQITPPPRSLARENSTITNKSFNVGTSEENALDNNSTDINNTKSDGLFPQRSVSRNTSSIVIPDDDDDETRHKRIELSLDMEIHELESKASGAKPVEVANGLAPSAFAKESQGNYVRAGGQVESAGKGGADFERVKSFYKEYFPSEAVEGQAPGIRAQPAHINYRSSEQHP